MTPELTDRLLYFANTLANEEAQLVEDAAKELDSLREERERLQSALYGIRKKIAEKLGGLGPGSAVWGSTQYDKGWANAITAILGEVDESLAAIAKLETQ